MRYAPLTVLPFFLSSIALAADPSPPLAPSDISHGKDVGPAAIRDKTSETRLGAAGYSTTDGGKGASFRVGNTGGVNLSPDRTDSHENGPALTQNVSPGKEVYFWNNIIVPPAGQYCLRPRDTQNYDVITIQNNHCITTSSPAWDPNLTATTKTISTNVEQTPTVATGQGYTTSQSPYVYFPTSGGSTIVAGVDLTSNCSGGLAGLCSDTSFGSVVGVGNAITGAGRTARVRPNGSAWDAGAYQYVPPSSALSGAVTLGGAAGLQ